MTNLLLNGTEINSLAELQENHDSGQIKEAFVTGTLKKWLEDRYYIKEAAAVGALGKEMHSAESGGRRCGTERSRCGAQRSKGFELI